LKQRVAVLEKLVEPRTLAECNGAGVSTKVLRTFGTRNIFLGGLAYTVLELIKLFTLQIFDILVYYYERNVVIIRDVFLARCFTVECLLGVVVVATSASQSQSEGRGRVKSQ